MCCPKSIYFSNPTKAVFCISPRPEGKADVIKGLGNEPKVIQLTGWIGLEGVCMVVRPWCLWGFVVALTSHLLSHYHHQFPTLWFPPPDTSWEAGLWCLILSLTATGSWYWESISCCL